MRTNEDFAARFRLALKALGFSRGRAAMDLGVDKSLVGRWASGAVRPSEHNLAMITRFVAARVPGFSMIDWDRDFDGFAGLLGIDPALARSTALPTPEGRALQRDAISLDSLSLAFLGAARAETERRGEAYEGFWRTTRPSIIMEGRLFHDHGMIRIAENGLLEIGFGGAGLAFEGWLLPAQGNLFAIIHDGVGQTPLFLIFRGVPLPKAMSLDGIALLAALDAARTPAAIPILLERIGDLSGDRAADEKRFKELVNLDPLAREGEVQEDTVRHLIRDFGPQAAAAGGELFLTIPPSGRWTRGASRSGELQG